MELKIFEHNHHKVAQIVAEGVVINTMADALDIIANANYQEAMGLIVSEQNLDGDFFDLSTGLAGDILQKCANYRMKLAIVGDFDKFQSKSFKAFMVECNRGKAVFFMPDEETALSKITQ